MLRIYWGRIPIPVCCVRLSSWMNYDELFNASSASLSVRLFLLISCHRSRSLVISLNYCSSRSSSSNNAVSSDGDEAMSTRTYGNIWPSRTHLLPLLGTVCDEPCVIQFFCPVFVPWSFMITVYTSMGITDSKSSNSDACVWHSLTSI